MSSRRLQLHWTSPSDSTFFFFFFSTLILNILAFHLCFGFSVIKALLPDSDIASRRKGEH